MRPSFTCLRLSVLFCRQLHSDEYVIVPKSYPASGILQGKLTNISNNIMIPSSSADSSSQIYFSSLSPTKWSGDRVLRQSCYPVFNRARAPEIKGKVRSNGLVADSVLRE